MNFKTLVIELEFKNKSFGERQNISVLAYQLATANIRTWHSFVDELKDGVKLIALALDNIDLECYYTTIDKRQGGRP